MSTYIYPKDKKYKVTDKKGDMYAPYGSQSVHDKQENDDIDEILQERGLQFDYLRSIKLPVQRSEEWFEMRKGKITASDGGCVLGLNKYEPQYKFIIKKTVGSTFKSNNACYYGKKLEEPATMIYAYRLNVRVDEFGLLGHQSKDILGASPDGICNRYKYDKKTLSKYVGRMLEIKCPLMRAIKRTGGIKGNICPIYYWIQVQLQLECCDLDECDFWQCKFYEYNDRDEFMFDTKKDEPFRSKKTGFEKGCLIELVPADKFEDLKNGNLNVLYEDAIHIYPKKIEMTPLECDMWISKTLANLHNVNKLNDNNMKKYVFYRVVYWRLTESFNVTIKRDTKWFAENYPTFEKMWGYILFLRDHKDKLDLLVEFIDSLKIKKNTLIMETIQKLCNNKSKGYKKFIMKLKNEIKERNKPTKKPIVIKTNDDSDGDNDINNMFFKESAFVEESDSDIEQDKQITKNSMFVEESDSDIEFTPKKKSSNKTTKESMFCEESDSDVEFVPKKKSKKIKKKKKSSNKSTKESMFCEESDSDVEFVPKKKSKKIKKKKKSSNKSTKESMFCEESDSDVEFVPKKLKKKKKKKHN